MIRHLHKTLLVCSLLTGLLLAGCGNMKLTADNAAPAPEAALVANLTHAWLPPQCDNGGCTLMSGIAPALRPPAMVAVLTYEPYKGSSTNTLAQILEAQSNNIRTAANPTAYLDHDGRTVRQNVATWTEQVDGHDVGYIKHFMQQGGVDIMVRHAVVFDAAGRAYLVHLMSLDDAHRAEVLADQETVVARIAAQGAGGGVK